MKATDYIAYDKHQGNQTLYARWEKNKIIFDMNGATSEQIEDIVCSSNTTIVKLPTPSLSFDVDYYVTGYEGVYKKLPIYKNFEGWYIEGTDIRVTEYDLSQPNIGTLRLVARWSDYIWNTPTEERIGYNDVTTWYYRNQYADDFIISSIDDDTLQLIIDNGLTLYGKENLINYNITYTGIEGVINFVPQKDSYTVKDVFTFEDGSILMRKGYEFDGWYADGYSQKITSTNQLVSLGIGNVTLTAKWNAKTYIIEVNVIDVNQSSKTDSKGNPKYGTNATSIGSVYNKVTLYYTFGDETKGIEQGYYTNAALTTKATINTFGEYADFIFGGLFESEINDNGHSYASYDASTCVFSSEGEFLSAPSLLNEQILNGNNATLYALLNPQVYTITFDINSAGLLDNVYASDTYLGNNLTIAYDSETRAYTLTNSGPSDPYCTIGQYVNLEANVDYYVHMTVGGSTGANAIQMFYGIDGNFTESNSVRFGNDQTNVIRVTESGKYRIRFDNDSATVLTVTNFWISPIFTREVTSYYNEYPEGNIVKPQSVYYIADNPGVDVFGFDDDGVATFYYSISGNTGITYDWSKKYVDYEYIKTADEFNSIFLSTNALSGKYMLLSDIVLGERLPIGTYTWADIVAHATDDHYDGVNAPFIGEFDGGEHTITYSITIDKSDTNINYWFSYALFGSAKDAKFRNIKLNATVQNTNTGFDTNTRQCIMGGLVGNARNCTFENIAVMDGSLIWNYETDHFYTLVVDKYKAATYAGGVVGEANGCTFIDCVNNATVHSTGWSAYAGGIAGNAYNCTFQECSNTGVVTAVRQTRNGNGSECNSGDLYGKNTHPCYRLDGTTRVDN